MVQLTRAKEKWTCSLLKNEPTETLDSGDCSDTMVRSA
jgi:hypothetical protein